MAIEHWYWCVDCKTPRCAERQALRYIGPAFDWPEGAEGIERTFPTPLTLQCRSCRYTHRYTLRDLRPFRMPEIPPEGFTNKF